MTNSSKKTLAEVIVAVLENQAFIFADVIVLAAAILRLISRRMARAAPVT